MGVRKPVDMNKGVNIRLRLPMTEGNEPFTKNIRLSFRLSLTFMYKLFIGRMELSANNKQKGEVFSNPWI